MDGRLLFAQVNNCPDLDWEERKLNADQEPPNYVEKDDWNSRLHSFIHIKLSLCSLFIIILIIWLYKYCVCVWKSLSAWGNGILLWIALLETETNYIIVGTQFLWEGEKMSFSFKFCNYPNIYRIVHFHPRKCTLCDIDYMSHGHMSQPHDCLFRTLLNEFINLHCPVWLCWHHSEASPPIFRVANY